MNKKPWLYSLEYYVSTKCCNSCVGCSHGAPLHSDLINVDTFTRDIKVAGKIINAYRFALSGGEPLLNPNLVELMRIARASGFFREVMVLTNGLLLDNMDDLFWESLDVLRISAYPNQLSQEQLDRWEARSKEHGAEFSVIHIDKFYIPLTKESSGPKVTKQTFDNCPYFHKCSAIYRGRYYPCSQAFFFPELMSVDPNIDSIALSELTREKLGAFMYQEAPLTSCQRCSYTTMEPWRQCKPENWLKESTVD